MGKLLTRLSCPFCGHRHWLSLLEKPLPTPQLVTQIAAGYAGFQEISKDNLETATDEQIHQFFIPIRERLVEVLQQMDEALIARGVSLERADFPEEDQVVTDELHISKIPDSFEEEASEDQTAALRLAAAQLMHDIDRGKV